MIKAIPTENEALFTLWRAVLRYLKENLIESWRQWFEYIEPIGINNGVLQLRFRERSWLLYFQQVCHKSLITALHETTGELITPEYHLEDPTAPLFDELPSSQPCPMMPGSGSDSLSDHLTIDLEQETKTETITTVDRVAPAPTEQASHSSEEPDAPIYFYNPDYTFENFVIGPSNRMAQAACHAVTETEGNLYNPLFIYGSVGLGKTHLLQSTAQTILKAAPDKNVRYLSCETFINQFIRAISDGRLFEFQDKYRHVDVLIIDDIQFLSDCERSQEEFFHTFNALYESRKQIILSADSSPIEIEQLEERLASRFYQGLVTRIKKPSLETRIAILQKKALLRGIDMPPEIITYIAKQIDSNIRQLEGALTRVHSFAMLNGGNINLPIAEKALGEDTAEPHARINISEIIDTVVSHFDVKTTDLQSKRRSRGIALPRHICMFLARDLTGNSLEEIGGHFGARNHTTVLHACKKINGLCQTDQEVRAIIKGLTQQLTASN